MSLQHRYLECEDEVVDHFYLCHYRPLSAGADLLSRSLIQFKAGNPMDVKAWMEVAIEEWRSLIESDAIIIRPLGHDEEQCDKTNSHKGLDRLGNQLAGATSCQYRPDLLRKSIRIPPLKALRRKERFEVMENCYALNLTDVSNDSVVVIDDILTTGATIQAIIALLRKENIRVPITVFTLAYSWADPDEQQPVNLKSLHYKWDPAGKWIAAESEDAYLAFNRLREIIATDSF